MITPLTIEKKIQALDKKYSVKILKYLKNEITEINRSSYSEIEKMNRMINLLEGFYRFLNLSNKQPLFFDIENLLVLVYYPESEELTLQQEGNLLSSDKGEIARFWHDAYFENNRSAIYNCFFDCKRKLNQKRIYEYIENQSLGMPEGMQKKYEEMLSKSSSLQL